MSLLKSLKGQILALSSACLVLALLVLTVANFLVARSQARDSLIEESLATAKSHVETIEEWGRGKALIVAASVTAFDEPEPVKTLALLRDAGKFSTFYFGFADKKYVFSETRNLPADYDPTARPWYKQAAAAGGPVITPPYISASDGKLVVTFASPVGAGSALKGVAAGDVSMESVVATVASVRPTPQSFGFMASSDGKIIAHPDAALTLKPLSDLAPALTSDKLQAAAKSRELLGIDIGGRQRLLTVVPIAGTSWMLVVALDESEAMAPIRAMLTTSVVSSIVVLAIAVALLAAVLTQRLRRLTQVRDAMHEVGEGDGDLSRRIDTHGEDELAQIASSYNNFAGKLSGVLGQIREASGSVRVAAEEIATGNQDLSGRTELTASSLQETSASMQQLTETVRQNADAARQANQLVAQASSVAQHGGAVVGNVVTTMDKINAASRKINDIIGVIDGIAFQTNILALNAAVEAARAGEQGRGFAVVAGEVRSLAQRSAEAAREIKTLINTSVEQVENGSRLVHDAGTTMTDIVTSVQRVTDIMAEITASTNEQSTSIGEVGQAVAHLDQMTQQNAALVEQSAAAAQSLKDQSVRLSEVVGTFRLSTDSAHAAPRLAPPGG
ncbi:chemotaxis protein [Acidovorax sp. Leaf76]|uniref:methyl-accepting chemotaxis protein n=1 Tax=unclassified Acidovorax TaxID=2684926 RepID=UPI0006F928F2|nr:MULTISPECIES: methyl-accepting chemotaxis protein [unclassified Acidovorax]KQO15127.1 chemotaxis protein [Acidovorax sp. Leaf76]KQO31936.1 chemotaxis protein [Acidovorax sp. Leaf84]KQS28999.1 chemotaxis protein [Acidovorax sp. Leaf191]